MTKRIAYLVHGYLGAGKTTFAKELAERTGAVRYSPDELMVARYGHEHFRSLEGALSTARARRAVRARHD